MAEDKTRCEQCGWVGADSLLIEVRHYDDADIMCPACQQVIMGEEPRLADWKALCLAAEAERDALAAELATVKPDAELAAKLRQTLGDRGWVMRWDLPLDQMVERAFLEERRVSAELSAELNEAVKELTAIKAALPRWRKDDDGVAYRLTVGPIERWVEPCGDGMWRAPYIGTTRYSRADAMLAVTEALGLPPCEVCE